MFDVFALLFIVGPKVLILQLHENNQGYNK